MTAPMKPPVSVGDVIRVGEPDVYGTGPLILRVTKVGRVQQMPDGHWFDLEGLTLRPDGSQIATEPRHALVRVRALVGRSKPSGAKS